MLLASARQRLPRNASPVLYVRWPAMAVLLRQVGGRLGGAEIGGAKIGAPGEDGRRRGWGAGGGASHASSGDGGG